MVLVIGINGSPRKYGYTVLLLKIALEAARREGADVELINLYDYHIEPCIGCVSDHQTACRVPCVINDDMNKLYELIEKSKGIIIATPVYWFSTSGVVKNFIDRLTAMENMIFIEGRSRLEGKVAGFIAVGNDSGSIMTTGYLALVLNQMGVAIPPWAMAYYNSMKPVYENKNVLLDAANVGRNVALMALKGYVEVWYTTEMPWLDPYVERLKEELEEERKKEMRKREELFKLEYERA